MSGHAPEPGRRAGSNRRVELWQATLSQFFEAVGRLHHKHTDKAIIKNGPASRLHRLWPMVRLSYPIGALGLGNHAVSGSPASDCCGHVRAVGFFKHLHDAIRIMFPRETPQIRSRLVNRLKRARQPRRSMAARRSAKDAEGTFVRTRGNDGLAPIPAVRGAAIEPLKSDPTLTSAAD
jgi:hypothetical protein